MPHIQTWTFLRTSFQQVLPRKSCKDSWRHCQKGSAQLTTPPQARVCPPCLAWASDANIGALYNLDERTHQNASDVRRVAERQIFRCGVSRAGFKETSDVLPLNNMVFRAAGAWVVHKHLQGDSGPGTVLAMPELERDLRRYLVQTGRSDISVSSPQV